MNSNKKMKLPDNVLWFGRLEEAGGYKLYVKKIILDEIESYLESDTNKELGGVLIGECISEPAGTTVKIEDIIIARHTEAELTKLTFTHETWIDINDILEKNYPGKIITGWFHSHPGHGVFMSGYDKFIHENFFNAECMVALVYDPVKREKGFFYFKDDNIIELKSYGVYSECKSVMLEPVNLSESINRISSRKKINIKDILLYILALFNVFLLMMFLDTRQESELLNLKVEKQSILTDSLKSDINGFSEILNSIGNFGSKDSVSIIRYTIKPGDNLRNIAVRFYDNPAMFDTIINHNKLKDEFDIYPGKEIEIP